MMHTARHLAVLLVVLLTAAACAQLVENVQPMVVTKKQTPLAFISRVETAPKIDGKLDDACWQSAARVKPMRNASSGQPAIEQAEGYVCYDDEAIYIAVDAEEGQIEHLQGTEQKGREDAWGGDEIELFIAPHGDGRYYQFTVGPKFGQRLDFSSDEGMAYHDKRWLSAVGLDHENHRAIIEVRIPFTAFGMNQAPDKTLWGFNIGRQNQHTEPPTEAWAYLASQELSQWSPTGLSFRNSALFGRIFFGDAASFAKRREPLQVKLIQDRYEYDNLDGEAQAVIDLHGGGRPLSELTVYLQLSRDDQVLQQRNIGTPSTMQMSMLLPVDQLQPGNYKLTATLQSPNAKPAESTWTFMRVDRGLAEGVKRAGRIKLNLPLEDTATPWPVRTGIPMPKGVLKDPARVRLLVNGKPAPCQTSVRGRWSPRGSIRWLGLTFIAEDPDATYELQYGCEPGPAPKQPVTINNQQINTGPLQVSFDNRGITNGTIDGKRVVDTPMPAYVVDKNGKRFTASGNDIEVTVEEAGPVHGVVRIAGWFTADDGEKLCKFTTYYEAFAGLPHVFVDHTVVLTYDTRENKLLDIGFPIGAIGSHYAFGTEDAKAVIGPRDKRVFALQDRWDHYAIHADSVHEGERLGAWATAGGVTLTGQYVPERFPKEFSVDQDKLTYHLWPADVGDTFADEEELAYHNIYKFFAAHEGPGMDIHLPKAYFDKGREYDANSKMFTLGYCKDGVRISNGQGVAINEPFVLTFHADTVQPSQASAFAKTVEVDPHAIAEPRWTQKTQVFGPYATIDRENYPEIAEYMGPALLSMCLPMIQASNAYGMFNFADVHTYFDFYNEPNTALNHRVWLNHHHAQNPLAWHMYAYYGEPKYLQWARVNSQHTMNIDICHYEDPDHPLMYHKLGAFYHVKGYVHWGGDSGIAHHLISTQYMQWAWALTGRRRARDVLQTWVKGIIKDSPDGYGTREGQTTLGEVAGYYMNHWDPQMLVLMHDFAEAIKTQPLREHKSDMNWNPDAFLRYDALTGDPEMLDLLKDPDFRKNEAPQMDAYLYLITGDESYLDQYEDIFERIRVQYRDKDSSFDGLMEYGFLKLGRELPTLMLVQKAFEKAGRKITPDLERDRPAIVETGPVSRDSPQDYTLGVMKRNGQSVHIEGKGEIVITSPNGQTLTAITPEAPSGMYQLHVKSDKLVSVTGADVFFYCEAGKEYGLLANSMAKFTPITGSNPVSITLRTGDKRPAVVTVVDEQGRDIASVSNHYRLTHRNSTLTIPVGEQYSLVTPQPLTFKTDRDVAIVLHSGSSDE